MTKSTITVADLMRAKDLLDQAEIPSDQALCCMGDREFMRALGVTDALWKHLRWVSHDGSVRMLEQEAAASKLRQGQDE